MTAGWACGLSDRLLNVWTRPTCSVHPVTTVLLGALESVTAQIPYPTDLKSSRFSPPQCSVTTAHDSVSLWGKIGGISTALRDLSQIIKNLLSMWETQV